MTGTDDDQTPEMPDEPEMSDDLEMSGEKEQPSDADGIGVEGETEDLHLNMQCAILDAALPHAAFDGWTRDVLVQAAFDVELSEADVDLAFPRGPVDAVLLHARLADEDMTEEMATLDLEEMRTRDKIAIAIRVRLEAQIVNREAIRRGLRLLAAPRNLPDSTRSLAKTVDTIWQLAGDQSTDFNFYSKRGLLAGVYSATLVYWLQDESEDQHKTWEFLTKRIGEVLRVGQATSGLASLVDRMPNPFRLCGEGRRHWREGPVHD